MTIQERDLDSMNPTELLREQTRLLSEINLLAIQVRMAQDRLYSQVANLANLIQQFQRDGIPSKVSDVEMAFGSMIVFRVKWAIASIPAAVILAVFIIAGTVVVRLVLDAMGGVRPLLGF